MSAGNLDITIEQGATFTRSLAITANSVAVNLTGCTLRGQIRSDYDSSVVVPFTLAVTNAVGGLASWTMSAALTASIPASDDQSWVYDIELVHADTTVDRLLNGVATISREVTR